MVSTLEQMQVPNGTGPGVRRSKRPLLAQTILTRKILMRSNATNQPKSIVEFGCMCPRGLSGPPAVTTYDKIIQLFRKPFCLSCII